MKYLHENRTEGCTTSAMDWAAEHHHWNIVQYLLKNRSEGCRINIVDIAAEFGHLDVIKYLHENDIEAYSVCALDWAIDMLQNAATWILSSISMKMKAAQSILDSAARNGHFEIVKYLRENRTEGCTTSALDSAAKNGHFDIVNNLGLINAKKTAREVLGLRLNGTQVIPETILYDNTFVPCPIAHTAGIPLYVHPTNMLSRKNDHYIISRVMSDPKTGVSNMQWQYGGNLDRALQILIARSDGVEFSAEDWKMLDDFEMKMLNNGPRDVCRNDFKSFAKVSRFKTNILALEVIYPGGQQVRVHDLVEGRDLNNSVGRSTGQYKNGRVIVKINNRSQPLAIKVENLAPI
ncbi:hypothetical protein THRCLA_23443 [Thraustotheca clavata]|uniref:Uncharacterized protein n=1 Tax=Thraustotheca clavata TaxID=74557 RepID=A0A1V9Y4Q0_9STRA|nr:hypothetical protein THRCLA_23443 [Thraustotheca clavata]